MAAQEKVPGVVNGHCAAPVAAPGRLVSSRARGTRRARTEQVLRRERLPDVAPPRPAARGRSTASRETCCERRIEIVHHDHDRSAAFTRHPFEDEGSIRSATVLTRVDSVETGSSREDRYVRPAPAPARRQGHVANCPLTEQRCRAAVFRSPPFLPAESAFATCPIFRR